MKTAAPPALTEDEAYEIGVEAYTYAYPLVLMAVTNRVTTNVARPDSATLRAPYNQLVHATVLPDDSFKDVVRVNADTLYSLVRYDVSREPMVITVPDTAGAAMLVLVSTRIWRFSSGIVRSHTPFVTRIFSISV